jgi:hypothetical protein
VEPWEQGDISGMRGLAHRLGLRYCADTTDRGYQDEVGGLALIGILADIEPEKQVSHLMYGRHLDRNIEVFDVNLGAYPDDPSHPVRSCALVTFAADFPRITIGPHSRMSQLRLTKNRQWLGFAPDEFRTRFNVEAPDNDAARAVLSDDMIGWLMAGRDDIRLTIDGGALLGHLPLLGDEDEAWDPFIDYVVSFHAAIPAQAWADFSLFGSLG